LRPYGLAPGLSAIGTSSKIAHLPEITSIIILIAGNRSLAVTSRKKTWIGSIRISNRLQNVLLAH
jgi:hypothetical protein